MFSLAGYPLGMVSGNISNWQLSASRHFTDSDGRMSAPESARLNGHVPRIYLPAWRPHAANIWLHVDLLVPYDIYHMVFDGDQVDGAVSTVIRICSSMDGVFYMSTAMVSQI